jgi:hypothetical protein
MKRAGLLAPESGDRIESAAALTVPPDGLAPEPARLEDEEGAGRRRRKWAIAL